MDVFEADSSWKTARLAAALSIMGVAPPSSLTNLSRRTITIVRSMRLFALPTRRLWWFRAAGGEKVGQSSTSSSCSTVDLGRLFYQLRKDGARRTVGLVFQTGIKLSVLPDSSTASRHASRARWQASRGASTTRRRGTADDGRANRIVRPASMAGVPAVTWQTRGRSCSYGGVRGFPWQLSPRKTGIGSRLTPGRRLGTRHASHQSTIHHQPSTIVHQPSTIVHQPSLDDPVLAPAACSSFSRVAICTQPRSTAPVSDQPDADADADVRPAVLPKPTSSGITARYGAVDLGDADERRLTEVQVAPHEAQQKNRLWLPYRVLSVYDPAPNPVRSRCTHRQLTCDLPLVGEPHHVKYNAFSVLDPRYYWARRWSSRRNMTRYRRSKL
ncbi:hypothetical protein BDV95DRAFT_645323 [Massariosphaeria phaeospora]|uniref:Uncharacterized protein n=1 Tax=Massariosphaeria phaeospora TaxID=100035 RepID=A0A7C8MII7_9PLEO|nr:hypothetical protein BDV95DRAFT_645323 [Massariosphaeria phaeospora]